SGVYYWNLAWFSRLLPVYIEELERYAPRHVKGLRQVVEARNAGNLQAAAELYAKLPVEVVDRSVMEKTDRLLLVPAEFEWADIGNWAELAERVQADASGNSVEGESILIDRRDIVVPGYRRLIAP